MFYKTITCEEVQRPEALKTKISTMRMWDILYRPKHQTNKGSKINRNQLGQQKLTAEAIYVFFNRLSPLCIIETN